MSFSNLDLLLARKMEAALQEQIDLLKDQMAAGIHDRDLYFTRVGEVRALRYALTWVKQENRAALGLPPEEN